MEPHQSSSSPLLGYEQTACDAVGRVIEFWGFKRNQGRLWALVYLRGRGLTASELMEGLGLSKGAVSILTKELETWGVLHRVKNGNDGLQRFEAVSDLLHMVTQVFKRRESILVHDVRTALLEAKSTAVAEGAEEDVIARIDNMVLLAQIAGGVVNILLERVPTNLTEAVGLLPRKFRSTTNKIKEALRR